MTDIVDPATLYAAKQVLAQRVQTVRGITHNVPSPCVSICRMTEDRSLCQGCYRTLDELRAWAKAGDDAKKIIWTSVAQRLFEAHPELRPSAQPAHS